MIGVAAIAEVLGLPRVRSLADLEKELSKGLPKASLRKAAARAADDKAEQDRIVYRIVPQATYKRRGRHLKPAEGERAERVARVVATAEYVWDDPQKARRFLAKPHPLLEGRTPLELAFTEIGARRVEELLWRGFYGIPV